MSNLLTMRKKLMTGFPLETVTNPFFLFYTVLEYDKASKLITKFDASAPPPKTFIRTLVQLEEYIKETTDREKSSKKKMNQVNAKSFNAMKQKIKKAKQYESAIEDYRKVLIFILSVVYCLRILWKHRQRRNLQNQRKNCPNLLLSENHPAILPLVKSRHIDS